MKFNFLFNLVASASLALANITIREAAKDFLVGVAANTESFGREGYLDDVKEFNYMVAENGCKFLNVHPEQYTFNFTDCDAHYEKALEFDMKFRGHCLLWYGFLPMWMYQLKGKDVEQAIVEHITGVLEHYRGKIDTWDVVNEAIADNSTGANGTWDMRKSHLYNEVPNYVDIAYKTAREVDPTVKLFYNDYDIEGIDIREGNKTNAVYNFVKDLVDRGVPIDGVGLQYHLHTDKQVKYENVMDTMARFGELGLEVQITEIDVNSVTGASDEVFELQARLYKEGLKACLDSPNCTAFIIWGIDDASSWRSEGYPLIFNADFTPKPAYYSLLNLLKEYNHIEDEEIVIESDIESDVEVADADLVDAEDSSDNE